MLTNAPPDAVYATNSFIAGVNSVCGANTIGAIHWSIHGSIAGGNTGMVRLLNMFFQITIVNLNNCFIPVDSVSNCIRVACKIRLCASRRRCL